MTRYVAGKSTILKKYYQCEINKFFLVGKEALVTLAFSIPSVQLWLT